MRDKHLGGHIGDYASYTFVQKELGYANSIFDSRPGWEVIDVTNKPIEEIAEEILATMKMRKSHDDDQYKQDES